MFTLQRCRSHELNSRPQAWESIQYGDEAEIVAAYFRTQRDHSGDQWRIVDEHGEQQAVLSPTTCGPLYYAPVSPD